MIEEFNLSEKGYGEMERQSYVIKEGINDVSFAIGDVKEFIRLLKEQFKDETPEDKRALMFHQEHILKVIDKLAGDLK
jgi:hypothetical protein